MEEARHLVVVAGGVRGSHPRAVPPGRARGGHGADPLRLRIAEGSVGRAEAPPLQVSQLRHNFQGASFALSATVVQTVVAGTAAAVGAAAVQAAAAGATDVAGAAAEVADGVAGAAAGVPGETEVRTCR
eukprot:CAMPEP_0202790646 /NCGR_PEP_ID=MMETSP1388-20130828/79906_1 /ASSEMBLY_ACC=CAM_ASM_000864 /TAXON_ID=37098 /ORGANISM="Isochrysis sp, Strain CCMP1244" /LENGTH=128 /DNA_ID=CAMNT_0049460385 /DNA_START=167 /DNA_END=554 /DNA_ORIENTATION=+